MLQTTTNAIGPLTVRVVADSALTAPSLLVVLCHGYGAPGDDLVSLAQEVCRVAPALTSTTRFLFPEAPLELPELPFGARAWWPIDMMRLQAAMATGQMRHMADEIPEGLSSARQKLRAMLDEALLQARLPMSRVVLGGFSQGSMLTTDTTLRLDEAPAALAILSGTLLNQEGWRAQAPKRRGLPVFQSHGRQDPILPWEGAESLKALLDDAGLETTFYGFNGGHGLDLGCVKGLAKLIEAQLPST